MHCLLIHLVMHVCDCMLSGESDNKCDFLKMGTFATVQTKDFSCLVSTFLFIQEFEKHFKIKIYTNVVSFL